MENENVENLEYLSTVSDAKLPEFVKDLPQDAVQELREYVNGVVEHETAGLDKFFESISTTMKYIPTFITLSVVKKYVEPPVAARISEKITLKQTLKIANGVSVEYTGEVARFLNNEVAGEILSSLDEKKAKETMEYVAQNYPLKALDVVEYLPEPFLKNMKSILDLNVFEGMDLHTVAREKALEKLKNL